MEYINNIFEYINTISKNNQFLSAGISMWGLGILTYICRHLPLKLWRFVIKHITTEMTITSTHVIFHNLLSWLEKNKYSEKFRNIKLTNGRWGYDKTIKSIGYGNHLMWFKYRPIIISMVKDINNKSENDKDIIKIYKFGRSHKIFNELFKQIKIKDEDKNKIEIYNYDTKSNDWNFIYNQPKRNINTVFIDNDIKNKLLTTIDNFINNEKWYIKHGIPYQLGILLTGPTGTGKTSLIKALASYTNKKLCLITSKDVNDINNCFYKLPNNSICVLEDIDAFHAVNKRNKSSKNKNNEVNDNYTHVTLSDFLNVIDGALSIHGRILIMTSNIPEVLDDALIRPGRIDLNVKIDYMSNKSFINYLCQFFGESKRNYIEQFKLNKDISCANIQNDILLKCNLNDILNKYTIKI